MSLLTMCQAAADLIGITRPSAIVSSTDGNVRTLLAMAQLEGAELLERYAWPEANKEATHTTVATELQDTMANIASDFNYLIPETMWNRTQNRPIYGPLSPSERQELASGSATGPYTNFYFRGASLYMFPIPTAGDTVKFEYQSKNFCEASGGTDQSAWAADDDLGLLDENLMKLGIVWRFKKKNGFDYSEDFRVYEQKLANAMSRSGGKRTLDMSGRYGRPWGINAQEGSWAL